MSPHFRLPCQKTGKGGDHEGSASPWRGIWQMCKRALWYLFSKTRFQATTVGKKKHNTPKNLKCCTNLPPGCCKMTVIGGVVELWVSRPRSWWKSFCLVIARSSKKKKKKLWKTLSFPIKSGKKRGSVNPTGKWEEITKDFGPDQIGFGVLLKLGAIITQKRGGN